MFSAVSPTTRSVGSTNCCPGGMIKLTELVRLSYAHETPCIFAQYTSKRDNALCGHSRPYPGIMPLTPAQMLESSDQISVGAVIHNYVLPNHLIGDDDHLAIIRLDIGGDHADVSNLSRYSGNINGIANIKGPSNH